MANRKVSLLWYCRTPRGWRRFTVVTGHQGVEVSYPEGRYELLVYEGRKPVYKRAGDNAADALTARDREAHMLVARESATAPCGCSCSR
jgi:hypothetical protein